MRPLSEPNTITVGSLLAASKFLLPSLRLFGSDPAHMAIWLTRGRISVTVNGEAHSITSRKAVVISANTPKMITLAPDTFGTVVSLPMQPDFSPPRPLMIANVPNMGDQQRLAALLDQLQGETQASDDHAANATRHLAHYLFIHLMRLADSADCSPSPAQKLMADFTSMLERDFRSGRPLFDYARELGITTTHLSRISKELNNRSANQLIQDRTLAQARYELATGTGKINRIGADLGFTSPAYFTRLFTEKNGLAPGEFRARHLAVKSSRHHTLKAAE
jgi:AraC-like DNA-binding protein